MVFAKDAFRLGLGKDAVLVFHSISIVLSQI